MFTGPVWNARVRLFVLGTVVAGVPAAQADTFSWQDTCGTQGWRDCCERLDGHYNNWFLDSIGGALDCPGPLPQFGDTVFLGMYTVHLDSVAFMSDLNSGGVFELRPGTPTQLAVDGVATFENVFHFDGGWVTDGAFDIMYLVEFRGGDGKGFAAASFNVAPFAIARVTGSGDIFMNSAYLNIGGGGAFEFRSDASILNNPGQGGYAVMNAGHLLKDGSAGVSRIEVPLYNTGVVDVRTGTLRVDAEDGTSSGAFIIEPGGILEIAAHTFAPGATVVSDDTDGFVEIPMHGALKLLPDAAPSIPHLRMDPDSRINGFGDLYVSHSMVWFGGFLETSGTVILAGSTGITGAAEKGSPFSTLVNTGTMTWLEGNFRLDFGILDNMGIVDVLTDADLVGGTINNSGTFTKAASTGETTTNIVNNTGHVNAWSGRLTLGTYTQTDGITELDGGDLGFGNPGQFLGGVLRGHGTIFGAVVNDGATVGPGLSPGALATTGTYTQTADGVLEIELAGTTPGVEYDQLLVSSVATLGGTINVSLIDGYVPSPGDEFEVLTCILRDGTFATVNLPAAVSTRRFGLFYEWTRVVVRVGLAGDANCDGEVTFDDINPFVLALTDPVAYQAAFPTCPLLNADANGDGVVDFGDINPFVALLGG